MTHPHATRLLILLWLASLSCIPCHAGSLPSALLGRWQVSHVNINNDELTSMNYGLEEGRLRWRIFNFGNDKITDDTAYGANDDDACNTPQVSSIQRMNPRELMTGSLAHTLYGRAEWLPSPRSYRLTVADDKPVEAISIKCSDGLWQGDLGADGGVQGAWMFFTPQGELIVRWGDEVVLTLDRLPADAKPYASFDCRKASSVTETAICSSVQLASFDRSVAWAYQNNLFELKGDKEDIAELVTAQKAWLRKRDACGSDNACLRTSMSDRLEALCGRHD